MPPLCACEQSGAPWQAICHALATPRTGGLQRWIGTVTVGDDQHPPSRQSVGSRLFLSVFISAFLAATILPAQSEAVLAYHLAASPSPMARLVLVATIGNVLGAVVNWGLGRYLAHFSDRAWFPVRPDQMEKAERKYRTFGRYSLLLSWVPFIGDPITVIAGVLREPLWSFILLVTLAKAARYIAIAIMVANVIQVAQP